MYNKKIGILCWEENAIPKGVAKIASLRGSAVNKESYDFPVVIKRVKGANPETIIFNPSENTLISMIYEMQNMVKTDDVYAIGTSCGFNAIHQTKLANAVNVPVFAPSLLQVPLIAKFLKENQSIGILSARSKSLTKKHLYEAGITDSVSLNILGMEDYHEWNKLLVNTNDDIDLKIIESEICEASLELLKVNSHIGAFVLECTDMSPFSAKIREITELPVFDFITLAHYVYSSL